MKAPIVKVFDGESEDDVKNWDALIDAAPFPDVYFRSGYARASAAIENSKPFALVIEAGESKLLFPALLRTVTNDGELGWIDAASPYGYSGMVPLTNAPPVAEEASAAIDVLLEWCRDQHIVSYFFRTHPLLSAERVLPDLAILGHNSVQPHKKTSTVAIDLQDWNETLDTPAGLHQGKRSDLKHARKHLEVTWAPLQDYGARSIFRRIYEVAMAELSANPFHRFPHEYYDRLATLGPKVEVALAWQGSNAVAAAMFMFDRAYAHYHLSGTSINGRAHKAATLILVSASQRFRERGCKLMHLGGGMTPNDSLMTFKSSFGGTKFEYQGFTLVPDTDVFGAVTTKTAIWPYSLSAANR